MSATSKRDRALRDGVEPVTGKDMMSTVKPAPVVTESAEVAEESGDDDNGG